MQFCTFGMCKDINVIMHSGSNPAGAGSKPAFSFLFLSPFYPFSLCLFLSIALSLATTLFYLLSLSRLLSFSLSLAHTISLHHTLLSFLSLPLPLLSLSLPLTHSLSLPLPFSFSLMTSPLSPLSRSFPLTHPLSSHTHTYCTHTSSPTLLTLFSLYLFLSLFLCVSSYVSFSLFPSTSDSACLPSKLLSCVVCFCVRLSYLKY